MTDTSTSTNIGEARWWLGGLAVIKATAESTDGQLTIIEVTEPPGMEAPLHVHHNEDEGFFVLEGSVTIYVGDESVDARAGGFAWGPRGRPTPLHGRPGRLPHAVRLHARRVREARDGDERAGPQPHAPAAGRRGAGLGARREGGRRANGCELLA